MRSVAGSPRPVSWARTVPPYKRQNRDRLLKTILPPPVHRALRMGTAYVGPAGFRSANSWSRSQLEKYIGLRRKRGSVSGERERERGFLLQSPPYMWSSRWTRMYAEHDACARAHAHATGACMFGTNLTVTFPCFDGHGGMLDRVISYDRRSQTV